MDTRRRTVRLASLVALMVGLVAVAETATAAVTALTPAGCERMRARRVLGPHPGIDCERLATVTFAYVDFDGRLHSDGRVVVIDVLAADVEAIFRDLLSRRFPIARAKPIDDYLGSDDASMADDNTSAFNDRPVIGSTSISVHAYGAAIDVNPIENPEVAGAEISPPAGTAFARRTPIRPGMVEPVVGVFAAHGFGEWGGRWRRADFQHFQIPRRVAKMLAGLSRDEAFAAYARIRARGR